jgi:DNA-binding IclR family transcriptional regulator
MATPVWCTGAGRALLWDQSRAALEELLHNVEFIGVGGPDAPRSVDALHAVMERDRARGIIDASGEFEHGIGELSLPVINPQHNVVASVSILGRAEDLAARKDEIRRAIETSVSRLSPGNDMTRSGPVS